MNTKLKQVIESMHKENIDSMIVLKPENIRYLTGFRPSSSSILILKDNPVLLASKIDREDASGRSLVNLEVYKEFKDVKNYLEGKIGIENSMNVETYKKLTGDFELETTDIVEISRAVKSKWEVENIEKALQIAEKSLLELEFSGTEVELAAQLEYNMRINDSERASFETIVASGSRSSLPHGSPTKNEVEYPILIDWGAVYNNYSSDTTRTIIETEKQEEIFNIVLEAQQTAIKSIKPGVKSSEIDNIAREVITEYGYGDAFIHSTGHGVGLEIHEKPSLSKNDEGILEKDMVVTVEPGIYLEGEFGIRIEDMILIKNRATVLNKTKAKLSF
ncbi:M24 family metallopeptidase [Methanobacterium spitsbergense]|uniref:Aminopeptidase P family protein n=1 Tax=Methanobacterium spitsbergense TaxID=2874285 RepID=A0A8T5ULD9_9EURY|nr:aminopeptidase P family protein [Methanobacterium spitsbergense]MBZ2164698.1 aminopeptidase P family protein [Methanobacterium spitsbergense]